MHCLQAVAVVQDSSGRLSLYWVHDLHAGSQSLEQVHLQPREGPGGLMQSNPATPPELWSYLVQVCSNGHVPVSFIRAHGT